MDSELAFHHDRGPGEENIDQPATDKNPQESMTLKNALNPLPDSQRSRPENPEKNQRASAPHDERPRLISRPQDTDIDPAASFVFGLPVKVTPGQFGRGVPPKPINPVPEEPLGNHIPNVEHILVAEQPAVVTSDRVQTFSKPIPRRPLHIKHHPPQCSPPDHKGQRPTPFPSSVHRTVSPRDENMPWAHGDEAGSFEAGLPHQERVDFTTVAQEATIPRQPYQQSTTETNAATTQALEKNHRISLPNDTSISSPSALRHSPHGGSSRTVSQANRPVRDLRRASNVKTPTNRPTSRSSVYGSNISKKRSVNKRPALGTTRASRMHRRCVNEGQESPSARRRECPSVDGSQSLPLDHDHHPQVPCGSVPNPTQQVVQSMNDLFSSFAANEARAKIERGRLVQLLQKQKSKLSQCETENETSTNFIEELQKRQGVLQEQLDTANQELANRSEKTSKLEDKCRQYREHLNSAITEQQDLYKATSAKCENAIKQMRQEEDKQKALNAQERRQADATHEHLSQIVKSTIAEYKSKERECELSSLGSHDH